MISFILSPDIYAVSFVAFTLTPCASTLSEVFSTSSIFSRKIFVYLSEIFLSFAESGTASANMAFISNDSKALNLPIYPIPDNSSVLNVSTSSENSGNFTCILLSFMYASTLKRSFLLSFVLNSISISSRVTFPLYSNCKLSNQSISLSSPSSDDKKSLPLFDSSKLAIPFVLYPSPYALYLSLTLSIDFPI